VRWKDVPLLTDAHSLAAAGHITGGSTRNWNSYGTAVDLGRYGKIEQALLTDPQTSGGLLVACAPEAVGDVLDCFRRDGFARAAVIGEIEAGTPGITVV
jgi:selenide,water dikinase